MKTFITIIILFICLIIWADWKIAYVEPCKEMKGLSKQHIPIRCYEELNLH